VVKRLSERGEVPEILLNNCMRRPPMGRCSESTWFALVDGQRRLEPEGMLERSEASA